jgi:hypothetical protein
MKDYRLPEHRREYFKQLYRMNLQHGVMPGLVYLYMPTLAHMFNWDAEQRLWFAFLNGNTQNPVTSLRIFQRFPEMPRTAGEFTRFKEWFDTEWVFLSFDTDRRHQKRDLPNAVYHYAKLAEDHGSQEAMLTGDFATLWERVTGQFYSFGRLAAFSYLEYVYIMGFGADCDRLFLEDKSGSKSHRNGLLLLLGHDDQVWDKRMANGHDGSYPNFKGMCTYLTGQADAVLQEYRDEYLPHHSGYFTLESNLCTFKNGFFGRRYPGVYADMALDRIKWYNDRNLGSVTEPFLEMRSGLLPTWLREECEPKVTPRAEKARLFRDTGVPFRADNFITESGA